MIETKEWIEKAEKDLNAAEKSVKVNELEWADFQIQQATEKALKSVLIKKKRINPKSHDLVFLGRSVGLPKKILEYCKEMNALFLQNRYPDAPKGLTDETTTRKHMEQAKEILQWAKKNI